MRFFLFTLALLLHQTLCAENPWLYQLQNPDPEGLTTTWRGDSINCIEGVQP